MLFVQTGVVIHVGCRDEGVGCFNFVGVTIWEIVWCIVGVGVVVWGCIVGVRGHVLMYHLFAACSNFASKGFLQFPLACVCLI